MTPVSLRSRDFVQLGQSFLIGRLEVAMLSLGEMISGECYVYVLCLCRAASLCFPRTHLLVLQTI